MCTFAARNATDFSTEDLSVKVSESPVHDLSPDAADLWIAELQVLEESSNRHT
jgi:hypothetical protein